ncbi:MAG: FAD-dependent oxidoreductase, partial [Candidatus Cloacimonetes bacterium]|nr:FAD-dependent oxidoreductase [Candidatus Cloacimonadota bacterium]
RFGSIHRNTYLNSPGILNKDLSLKKKDNIFLAGQLSGVEGYVESILSGLLVSKNVMRPAGSQPSSTKLDDLLPETTISGQLWRHLITKNKNFQPMNANFGLLPSLEDKIKDKRLRKEKLAERAIKDLIRSKGENTPKF